MSQKAKAGQDIPVLEIKTDKFQVMPSPKKGGYQALKESIDSPRIIHRIISEKRFYITDEDPWDGVVE